MAIRCDGNAYLVGRLDKAYNYPFTLSGWVRPLVSSGSQVLISFESSTTTAGNTDTSYLMTTTTSNGALAESEGLGTAVNSSWSLHKWSHFGGVFGAAASRFTWGNGVKGTENTSNRAIAGLDLVCIGARFLSGSATDRKMQGELGTQAAWNVALSDEEMIALSRGVHPARIRPGNLIALFDLEIGNWVYSHPRVPNAYITRTFGSPRPIANPQFLLQGRRIRSRGSGTAAFTLDANSGSFVLSGTAASLESARILDAASGSYSVTGIAASLERGLSLSADAGSFVLSGQDISLDRNYVVVADAGAFTLSGTAASLERSRLFDAESGSFLVTGSDADLLFGRAVAADSGSFTFIGNDASLERGLVLSADASMFTLSGTDASLERGFVVTAESGTYVLDGQDATLVYSGSGATLIAESGSFTLSGSDTSLLVDRIVSADTGAFILSGDSSNLLVGRQLEAESGSFIETGGDAGLIANRVIDASSGSFVLTGQDAGLSHVRQLDAGSGSFIVTGMPADLLTPADAVQPIEPYLSLLSADILRLRSAKNVALSGSQLLRLRRRSNG